MRRRRGLRALGLVTLLLATLATPGCQFLQNEFFFFCPPPPSVEQPDVTEGPLDGS